MKISLVLASLTVLGSAVAQTTAAAAPTGEVMGQCSRSFGPKYPWGSCLLPGHKRVACSKSSRCPIGPFGKWNCKLPEGKTEAECKPAHWRRTDWPDPPAKFKGRRRRKNQPQEKGGE
ncbi:hypothetical protein VFPPC_13320 [Pochonia chlamydosporia 170]|uniref:Uncharacterized protein n=1 Tax=Pochonia chlamydosporia 170 TaxID=1380566 RepID=A0A179FWZ3_METCM|nr:hypothetical protein VFPPC_13320 [Pochonia chlamydosporia 170]OAQ70196.1 hypothetical protein VFPPC_13320 [Pochonia chlamydosporia 170]